MVELLRPTRMREFQIESVTLHEDQELGSGAYGKVCRAKFGDLPCAAKLLHPILFRYSSPGAHSVMVRKFEQECQLLSVVKHPCIVQYLATYVHPESGQPVLLMELIDESLTKFLERSISTIPLHTQTNITHNIALALAYLHSNEILHRDLTGNNVLVVAGKYAKVTDFGMLKIIDAQMENNPRLRQMTLCPGCPAYMPPEALRNPPMYTKKLDVFSLGVIIIQILTKRFPKPRDATRSGNDNEVERRRSHISVITTDHPLLPISLNCLRNTERERPTSTEVCRQLSEIKESAAYLESIRSETESIAEVDHLTRDLQSAREDVKRLNTQLDNLRAENRQLYRILHDVSDEASSPTKAPQDGPGRNGATLFARMPSNGHTFENGRSELDYESFSDEELELELNTPPSSVWYHGKIARDLASKRLHAIGRPGAYLVRNSESTPGSFVLTFLDRERRAFNYMINYKDGQFNASGQSRRWFPSLQHLIGYYTKFSTVKQNQHLEVPVAPPEVVPLIPLPS